MITLSGGICCFLYKFNCICFFYIIRNTWIKVSYFISYPMKSYFSIFPPSEISMNYFFQLLPRICCKTSCGWKWCIILCWLNLGKVEYTINHGHSCIGCKDATSIALLFIVSFAVFTLCVVLLSLSLFDILSSISLTLGSDEMT